MLPTIEAMSVAGVIAVVLIGVVVLFQILLALGAPWGAAAWGGRTAGVLPGGLRIASAVSALLLGAIAWVVLSKSVAEGDGPSWLTPALWVIVGYFALGAVMNAISRSRIERIWAPVSLAIAVLVGFVAAA